jgi:hypothetical protein
MAGQPMRCSDSFGRSGACVDIGTTSGEQQESEKVDERLSRISPNPCLSLRHRRDKMIVPLPLAIRSPIRGSIWSDSHPDRHTRYSSLQDQNTRAWRVKSCNYLNGSNVLRTEYLQYNILCPRDRVHVYFCFGPSVRVMHDPSGEQ